MPLPRRNTVIFWGAGATASMGMRTTPQQASFIRHLVGDGKVSTALQDRIEAALGSDITREWHEALHDLIDILGDDAANDKGIHSISRRQREAMRRSMPQESDDDALDGRIMALRLIYDWPALKTAKRICPAHDTKDFDLNDLFNVLDMHTQSGHGFRNEASQILTPRRLDGARAALQMLLGTMFYVDYQECIQKKRDVLNQYLGFARLIGERMQRTGRDLAQTKRDFEHPDFYVGNIHFVSFNYDPIGLWTQYIANRELNRSASVPHLGSPCVPLHILHDHGHLIPSRGIAGRGRNHSPWYPMNEAVAQRLNEAATSAGHVVRLTKYLFPHGNLCWRECPDCGKLSAYNGDKWDLASPSLIPPPPLAIFARKNEFRVDLVPDAEATAWNAGRIDARQCLHCGTLTSAHDGRAIMQSSFKPRPPSFIEEIQRDLRVSVMKAEHIIFMGYSLPRDDVTYRAFFSARRQRGEEVGGSPVRCTIVGKENTLPGWHGPRSLIDRRASESLTAYPTIEAAQNIFGQANVRFFGSGCPDVFLNSSHTPCPHALEKLLTWSES